MLSVLFATEAFYTIKENNKDNHFTEASYHFADVNYHFPGGNREKPILRRHFIRGRKLPFCRRKLRKAYFASAFSC